MPPPPPKSPPQPAPPSISSLSSPPPLPSSLSTAGHTTTYNTTTAATNTVPPPLLYNHHHRARVVYLSTKRIRVRLVIKAASKGAFGCCKQPCKKSIGRDSKGGIIILPPVSFEEHIAVQRETKARTLLLQSLPEDHMVDFHHLDDANQMQAKPDNDDVNMKFLSALPPSWSQVPLTLQTRGGLEYLSFDDLYNKLRYLEIDV
nr:xylulose kinase-1 [Tanacetum cinerariifolium]